MSDAPPFDGKPCPCCPVEVRDLYAVAYNFANTLQGKSTSTTTLGDLIASVEALKPLIEAHFADTVHAHGRVR